MFTSATLSNDGIKALHKESFVSHLMPLTGREGILICNNIVEGSLYCGVLHEREECIKALELEIGIS